MVDPDGGLCDHQFVTLNSRAARRPDVEAPPLPGGVLRFGWLDGYGDMVRLLG